MRDEGLPWRKPFFRREAFPPKPGLFRPQLTGGIKDLPVLGLRHGFAVGDEHLQMLDGFGDVDVQARRGSGCGTGAAFDEREDVLFMICVRKAV